jgi:hypothetical protein
MHIFPSWSSSQSGSIWTQARAYGVGVVVSDRAGLDDVHRVLAMFAGEVGLDRPAAACEPGDMPGVAGGERVWGNVQGWSDLGVRVFGVDGHRCPGRGKRLALRFMVVNPSATTQILRGLEKAQGPLYSVPRAKTGGRRRGTGPDAPARRGHSRLEQPVAGRAGGRERRLRQGCGVR